MRRLATLLLAAALPAWAAPDDAPLAVPAAAHVHLDAGQPATFAGELVSDAEELRRAKSVVDCKATLAAAEQNVLLPKPAVAALISAAAAAVITSISLGIALAAKK